MITAWVGTAFADVTAGPQASTGSTFTVNETTPLHFDFGPTTVNFSPTDGAIDKFFHNEQDMDHSGVVDAGDFNYLFTHSPQINESLVVGTGGSWIEWHESINTSDLIWGNVTATLAGNAPVPGLVVQIVGGNLTLTFDPLPAGSVLNIQKSVLEGESGFSGMMEAFLPDFVGAPGPSGVDVLEYPTAVAVPEPGSLAILGLASGGMMLQRIRRNGRR